VEELDVEAELPPLFDLRAGDPGGLVGGVIQHLHLQQVARVLELADRVDQARHHVELVVGRELDGDRGELALGVALLGLRGVLLVLVVEEHHLVAVETVDRQEADHGEVDEQERPFGAGHGWLLPFSPRHPAAWSVHAKLFPARGIAQDDSALRICVKRAPQPQAL
jgi:hypothetical protein